MTNLRSHLTSSDVQRLAGPRAFARGLLYHGDDRVQSVDADESVIRARVRGTVPYHVELRLVDDVLQWSCTCTAADDGSFCKHCVAVACVDTDVGERAFDAPATTPDDRGHADTVAAHLDGLPRNQLVALVQQAAQRDWQLRELLVAQARAERGQDVDVASWRRRLDEAFSCEGDLVAWDDEADWAAGIDDVLDAMENLAASGHGAAVVDLAEHAHRCVQDSVRYVDDSSGSLSMVAQRVADVHLEACRLAELDPVNLAARLVELELTSEHDGFSRAAAHWSDVLGPTGLAEYRRLVEPRWRAVDHDVGGWSDERSRIDEAMTGVALGVDDPDLVMEVQATTAAAARDNLDIVDLLVRADRHDEAIAWARQALDAMQNRPWYGSRLRDVLAEMLRDQGRTDEALQLYRDAFERTPSLSGYRALLAAAGRDTDEVRTWAIASLQAAVGDAATAADDAGAGEGAGEGAGAGARQGPSAALVEVLAHEGRVDEAWDVAVAHGCDDRMWLTLARERERDHPMGAANVYERLALESINAPSNHDYRHAVDLLTRIRRLADHARQPERFTTLLDRVRTEHSRKTNLRRLLDDQGW